MARWLGLSALALLCALAAYGCESSGDPPAAMDPVARCPDAAAPSDAGTTPDARVETDAGAGPDATTGPDAAVPIDAGPFDAGPLPSAQFLAIYDDIIAPSCGGETCHLEGTNDSVYFGFRASLQMPDARTAYAVLVNQPDECMSGPAGTIVRVVPYDPEASGLMIVAEDGLCGRRHNVVIPPSFTAEDLATIEAWIAAGAP